MVCWWLPAIQAIFFFLDYEENDKIVMNMMMFMIDLFSKSITGRVEFTAGFDGDFDENGEN